MLILQRTSYQLRASGAATGKASGDLREMRQAYHAHAYLGSDVNGPTVGES